LPYYQCVLTTLGLGDLWWRGVLSVVCLPHFEPEWSLRLLAKEGRESTLLLTEARSRISRADGAEVSVDRVEASVPAGIAVAAQEVWANMLARVQHPREPLGLGGYDGPVYHFTCQAEPGMLAGYALRLDQETPPARLIALAEALAEFARTPREARPIALAAVRTQLNGFRALAREIVT
jgi:hypothetical protein